MANPTCTTVNALLLTQPCYGSETLNARQRKSLRIWIRVNHLKAIGGTDYTTTLATTLMTDSNTFVGQAVSSSDTVANPSDFETASIIIDRNNAVNAGATISSTLSALMTSIAPLSKARERQLDAMLLLLQCRLGSHKAYPQ